jgi:thioredoxin reductase (NADPH)
MVHDVIIIGSGPAGYTAAIYVGRAELDMLLIEGSEVSGQLVKAPLVENFPGFPEGIAGVELMERLRSQAKKFGAKFFDGEVARVEFGDFRNPEDPRNPIVHKIFVKEKILETRALIIASGSRSKMLGVAGEKEYLGRGVSTCATCDAPFFKNKKVIVVGGGDSAGVEALFISKFAKSVTIVCRKDRAGLKMSNRLQEQVSANPKIDYLWNAEVIEIIGNDSKMSGVKIENTQTGEASEIMADGMFLAIGHIPNTDFLPKEILNKRGYVKTHDLVMTDIAGVFAAGDAGDNYRWWQAITAAGSGAAAALEAERFLKHGN